MFGPSMMVAPKVFSKFIMPNESVRETLFKKVLKEIHNNYTTPVYEIQPIFPTQYYSWSTKSLIEPGQYQFFLPDSELPLYVKAGSILPLLDTS